MKETQLKVGDKAEELKKDRSIFARMLIVADSRPDMSLETTIGTYELSIVRRSLFAADGLKNHCSDKSKINIWLFWRTCSAACFGICIRPDFFYMLIYGIFFRIRVGRTKKK